MVLINLGGEPAGMLRYKLKFKPGPAQRTSEAGSFVSCEAVTPSPRLPPTALASGNGDEHDATLASVSSKVSLARKAMAALTEELAELTGMDGSASGTPVGGGRRAPRLSTGSLSPLPSSPGAGVTGWRTPTPGALSSVSGGAAQEPNSIGQLLALYVGTDGVEQPLPDVADFEADARALVEMLQDALVAAHTEKARSSATWESLFFWGGAQFLMNGLPVCSHCRLHQFPNCTRWCVVGTPSVLSHTATVRRCQQRRSSATSSRRWR